MLGLSCGARALCCVPGLSLLVGSGDSSLVRVLRFGFLFIYLLPLVGSVVEVLGLQSTSSAVVVHRLS